MKEKAENTPPASPYNEEDDDLVYVGDDIDEVIDHLESFPDNEEVSDGGENFLNKKHDSLNSNY